jgi:hypothetical protein
MRSVGAGVMVVSKNTRRRRSRTRAAPRWVHRAPIDGKQNSNAAAAYDGCFHRLHACRSRRDVLCAAGNGLRVRIRSMPS